ncbi:MAG TPA: MoaD/ThiS family protein [Tepidisphaeraceae bacterium]|nr:MoaD/ThiS family protein [Tepidisphaeraceae bacterium]
MRIQVKLFAILRDQADRSETTLDLPEGATVQQARGRLIESVPAIASYMDHVAFAINLSYALPDSVLHDGDELAVLPPVSGG